MRKSSVEGGFHIYMADLFINLFIVMLFAVRDVVGQAFGVGVPDGEVTQARLVEAHGGYLLAVGSAVLSLEDWLAQSKIDGNDVVLDIVLPDPAPASQVQWILQNTPEAEEAGARMMARFED